jgi:hypothetical protein
MTYKYTAHTPVADIIAASQTAHVEACNTPQIKDALDWDRKHIGKTFGELVDAAIDDPNYDPHWAIWYLYFLGKETEPKFRAKMFTRIVNPMTCFQIYLTWPWLTDEEDKILEAKFRGQLPQAEKELKDRIVTRAKGHV